MIDSEGFNQYQYHDIWPNGLPLVQGIIGLPSNGNADEYYLIHQKYDFTEINGEADIFDIRRTSINSVLPKL